MNIFKRMENAEIAIEMLDNKIRQLKCNHENLKFNSALTLKYKQGGDSKSYDEYVSYWCYCADCKMEIERFENEKAFEFAKINYDIDGASRILSDAKNRKREIETAERKEK